MTPPALHAWLAGFARRHPMRRKLVVVPSVGMGRELLRRLALDGGGWLAFETVTVRPLAVRLARPALEEEGLVLVDAFEQQALLDEAVDATLADRDLRGPFEELADGVGFRQTVAGAVEALRLAAVSPRAVDGPGLRERLLSRVTRRYAELLDRHRRTDTAGALERAVEALDEDRPIVRRVLGDAAVVLVPGLGTRGLSGRLLGRLRERGAEVARTDPVPGLATPPGVLWEEAAPVTDLSWTHAPAERPDSAERVRITLFRAASPTQELRQVLRLALADGRRWDEVEIIAADAARYGSALHALSLELGVPATYAVGLPVERTRSGRVARAYLDWISGGFQAAPVRRLLEAGDLRPTRRFRHIPAAALARRFRSLRIGWGRARYRTQMRQAVEALHGARRSGFETEERFRRRIERERRELAALRTILFPALKATPSVPDRRGRGRPVSPSELASGLKAFLKRVPVGEGVDAAARDDLQRILDRVEATLRRRTDFTAAVAILRGHLEIRVRAPSHREEGDEGAPWRSEGGAVHLTDLEHGGLSGRPSTFLVGMDADTVPGGAAQDPVLPDSLRARLGADLPTSVELLGERRHRMAALLARLRGAVTFSYAAWSPTEARTVLPSPLLLGVYRVAARDPDADYEALHRALGTVVHAAPAAGLPRLDADDVWLGGLFDGSLFRRGRSAVRRAYPGLHRGLEALEADRGLPGPRQGVISARPEVMDPRRNGDLVLSASRLEALGACPRRYLMDTVLRVRRPDDFDLDPDHWLDALQRGSLLHAVFERVLRRVAEGAVRIADDSFSDAALRILAEEVETARREIPSPGEGVARREVSALETDVRSFVRMVRQNGAAPVALEFHFGLGEREPAEIEVGGGRIRLRGSVDRIDEELGRRRVIDYKTGRPHHLDPAHGVFDGGRRLQHGLYTLAVEALWGGEVSSAEYHFPTHRGENRVFRFRRSEVEGVREVVGGLLDLVAAGGFLPTDEAGDCRFCDFAPVCRVRVMDGTPVSPLAEWSEEALAMPVHEAVQALKRVRDMESKP